MHLVLPEIVAVGIYNSRLAVKDKKVTKNRKTTMFELEIPIQKGGISYIDAEAVSIEPDLLICAKPGQIRHTRLPFTCYYVHMIVREGLLYDVLMELPSFFKTEKLEVYKKLFKKLAECYGSGVEEDELLLQSLILELVHMLKRDSARENRLKNVRRSNDVMIDKVIKYIKENLQADLSLDAIAAYVNLSSIHFHNFFKTTTGKTLHSFVEEQRIKKASNLLVTTDWTLTRISEECGFSSQSYFSYAFKRKMHMTPREFAKTALNRYGADAKT
ncbi:MAG: helix-turn-helix transcriptional regulator [Clostridia bacterium]|nr:helix-turn-helix transcriptional regulator [Clostridia bacterium]